MKDGQRFPGCGLLPQEQELFAAEKTQGASWAVSAVHTLLGWCLLLR